MPRDKIGKIKQIMHIRKIQKLTSVPDETRRTQN